MISLLKQDNRKSHLGHSYLQVIKKPITHQSLDVFSRRYLRMNCTLFQERRGFLCCQCKLGQILEFFDKLVQGDTLLAAEANNIVPPVGQTFIYKRSGGRVGLRGLGDILVAGLISGLKPLWSCSSSQQWLRWETGGLCHLPPDMPSVQVHIRRGKRSWMAPPGSFSHTEIWAASGSGRAVVDKSAFWSRHSAAHPVAQCR